MKIGALIGSLHWRRLAASGLDHQRRFTAEIGRRVRQLDYRARVTQDPIAHWIDQDCWQPPSLHTTTYRAQRGFGGSNLPKVNEKSRDRNRRSATWFARNRLGGRGILYDRHISSVLSREWSRRMDLFTDIVAASAEASLLTANAEDDGDTTEPMIADYARPTAVKSAYLDVGCGRIPPTEATSESAWTT